MPSGFPDYEYFEIPLPVAQGGTGLTQWPGARVYNSANLGLSDNTQVILSFDSERYDTGELHSTSTNPSRLTAQQAGKYLITGHADFQANAAGLRQLQIVLNQVTSLAASSLPAVAAATTRVSVSTIYHLNAGDFVQLWAYQSSGGLLYVLATPNLSPEFAIQWVGP
jgi:hypothetical protein